MLKWQFKDVYRGMWSDAHINQAVENRKRSGATWTDSERRHLLAGYEREGMSVQQLARRHHRGELGVTIELSRILDNPKQCAELRLQLEKLELFAADVERSLGADPMGSGQALVGRLKTCITPYKEHPHARVLRAYAGGSAVQYRVNSSLPWVDYAEAPHQPTLGDSRMEWRVKPSLVIKRHHVFLRSGEDVCFGLRSEPGNLELTFEGEQLIDAKVLKP